MIGNIFSRFGRAARLRGKNVLFVPTCFAALLFSGVAGFAGALVEEETVLHVRINGRPYRLEALIVKPELNGRLPIALITHGRSHDPEVNTKMRARDRIGQARDLAHRGWLAVVVLRRGFGKSSGPQVAGVRCDTQNFIGYFEQNAADLAAALENIASRSDADATRVIAMGDSIGGATALAFAARQPKGLQAIINVSGGLRLRKDDACASGRNLLAAMERLAKRSRVPSLWLYAENDSYFAPELVREMHAAYAKGGGRADLQMFPPLPFDGHWLWGKPEGQLLWLPRLDAFLRNQNLPTWPAEKQEAVLKDERTGTHLRGLVENYFAAPSEKVLAVSSVRKRGTWWAGAELEVSRKKAMEGCEERTQEPCSIVMENFDLVGGATSKAE